MQPTITHNEYYKVLKSLKDIKYKVNHILGYLNKSNPKDVLVKDKALLSWIEKHGIILSPKLAFPSYFGKFYLKGISSKCPLPKNYPLIFVPYTLILDSSIEKLDAFVCQIIQNSKILISNVHILTISVLREYFKGEKSKYYEYLETIGNHLSFYFMPDELTRELIGNDTGYFNNEIEYQDLYGIYSIVCLIIKNNSYKFDLIEAKERLSNFNFQMFANFYCFVESRHFNYLNNALLIPIADAFNHNNVDIQYEFYDCVNHIYSKTLDFNPDSVLEPTLCDYTWSYEDEYSKNENKYIQDYEYFTFNTSSSTYKECQQVFNNYGPYSNQYFLKNYGFAMIDNPFDSIKITMNFPDEDVEFNFLVDKFFLDHAIMNENENISVTFELSADRLNLDFLNFMRFIYYYENVQDFLDNMDLFQVYKFSLEVELEILPKCRSFLITVLNKLNTYSSLQDDINNLSCLLEENAEGIKDKIILKFLAKHNFERIIPIIIMKVSQKELIYKYLNQILLLEQLLIAKVIDNRKIEETLIKEFESEEEMAKNREFLNPYFINVCRF